jgi:hypothetical protein
MPSLLPLLSPKLLPHRYMRLLLNPAMKDGLTVREMMEFSGAGNG